MEARRKRVARKVAHLRRLGADPSSAHEAAAARALADQLVARYALTAEELAKGAQAAGTRIERPPRPPGNVQQVVVVISVGRWGGDSAAGASGTTTGTGGPWAWWGF